MGVCAEIVGIFLIKIEIGHFTIGHNFLRVEEMSDEPIPISPTPSMELW